MHSKEAKAHFLWVNMGIQWGWGYLFYLSIFWHSSPSGTGYSIEKYSRMSCVRPVQSASHQWVPVPAKWLNAALINAFQLRLFVALWLPLAHAAALKLFAHVLFQPGSFAHGNEPWHISQGVITRGNGCVPFRCDACPAFCSIFLKECVCMRTSTAAALERD